MSEKKKKENRVNILNRPNFTLLFPESIPYPVMKYLQVFFNNKLYLNTVTSRENKFYMDFNETYEISIFAFGKLVYQDRTKVLIPSTEFMIDETIFEVPKLLNPKIFTVMIPKETSPYLPKTIYHGETPYEIRNIPEDQKFDVFINDAPHSRFLKIDNDILDFEDGTDYIKIDLLEDTNESTKPIESVEKTSGIIDEIEEVIPNKNEEITNNVQSNVTKEDNVSEEINSPPIHFSNEMKDSEVIENRPFEERTVEPLVRGNPFYTEERRYGLINGSKVRKIGLNPDDLWDGNIVLSSRGLHYEVIVTDEGRTIVNPLPEDKSKAMIYALMVAGGGLLAYGALKKPEPPKEEPKKPNRFLDPPKKTERRQK